MPTRSNSPLSGRGVTHHRRNAFYRLVGYAPQRYRSWIIELCLAPLTHPAKAAEAKKRMAEAILKG